MIFRTNGFALTFLTIILMSNKINSLATNNNNMASQTKEHIIHPALKNLSSHGMEKKELPYHQELRRASILVPLFERPLQQSSPHESNLHVLFTQRPQKMKSHGGEVCFPGGKQDAEDGGCDVTTALREAHEEVGLDPSHVCAVARMETVESKHSLCVTPIVGLIQPSSAAEPSKLTLNEHEVEAAFAVPLEYFTIPENLASIEMIKYGANREFLMRTYLFDDPESGRQFRIWGLTAHVVHQVAQLAFSR
jgi:8-oxo-dGTP pyrophosphatase MutT (NUDIX family)